MASALPVPSLGRRRFLSSAAGAAAVGALGLAHRAFATEPAFVDNPEGGYRFLPAGSVFNAGAIALPGHEIVHVLFSPWIPLDEAWGVIERTLREADRPLQALCGMELRIPRQLSFDGFRAFNAPYIERLRRWRLIFGEFSAVSRTNVAPVDAPEVPCVHAFSYAARSNRPGTTFCVSGTADIDPGGKIIAPGDVSRDGMRRKLEYVLDVISLRLERLGLSWANATHTDLCVARNLDDLLETRVIPRMQGAGGRGLRVHLARPPILEAEVELETRGVHRELVLAA